MGSRQQSTVRGSSSRSALSAKGSELSFPFLMEETRGRHYKGEADAADVLDLQPAPPSGENKRSLAQQQENDNGADIPLQRSSTGMGLAGRSRQFNPMALQERSLLAQVAEPLEYS